jgi:RsmE family RNA methyltransferase
MSCGVNLLLLEPNEIDESGRAALTGPRAAHVRTVLGLRAGDRLRAGVISGPIGEAVLTRVAEEAIELDVSALVAAPAAPPAPPVDLLLAMPRPKVLGRLLAPLACVGVRRVMLSNAAKVERFYFDTHYLDPAQVRARFLEGLAQARDTSMPELSVHKSFRRLVEDELDALSPDTERLLADEARPGAARIRDALGGSRRHVLLAVGPEGGWVDFERELLASRGFRAVSLGPRVLRSDLACLVALGLVNDALG